MALWFRIADNTATGGNTNAIVAPMFFNYVLNTVPTMYAFAIQTNILSGTGMASPYAYQDTFKVVKLDPTTGNWIAELNYDLDGRSSTLQFTEFRMVSDIEFTTADSIYIATGIYSAYSDWTAGGTLPPYYQALLLKIEVTNMNVQKYAYFNILNPHWAQDIVMGSSYLYMLGVFYESTQLKNTPFLVKMNIADLSVVLTTESFTTVTMGAPAASKSIGRLAVCELLTGSFFFL